MNVLKKKNRIVFNIVSLYIALYFIVVPVLTCCAVNQTGAVAVLDFQNLTGDEKLQNLGAVIPENISTYLASHKVLDIVERSRLESVLKESELSMAGLTDNEAAANIGKMLGASTVIVGSYNKSGRNIIINARAVDTTTGKVIAAVTKSGNGNDITLATREVSDTIIFQLTGIRVAKKKSIFKRWWFWGLVVGIAGGGAAAAMGGENGKDVPLPDFPQPPQ